jgi:AcrR family transcriptional regulator
VAPGVKTPGVAEDPVRALRALRMRSDRQLRQLIRRAAADGTPTQQIADAIGVSRATLWRRYRDDLQGAQGQRGR